MFIYPGQVKTTVFLLNHNITYNNTKEVATIAVSVLSSIVMTSFIEISDATSQLDAKMTLELENNHPYEALQYVQSYVARKKKLLGPNNTSLIVFHGASRLVMTKASSSAGTLLKWYIEDGAGIDFTFQIDSNNDNNFSDLKRLIDLLEPLSSLEAFPIVDSIYSPLHLLVVHHQKHNNNTSIKSSSLQQLHRLEELCAKIFLDSHKYYHSFKSYIRLSNYELASTVLLNWSMTGYATEKPLFFGRGILYLLSEGKIEAAGSVLKHSTPHLADNISSTSASVSEPGGADSTAYAVWHVSTIVTELTMMPVMPRVDKHKLFSILYDLYEPVLSHIDSKLVDMLNRIGEQLFQFTPPANSSSSANNGSQASANPMSLLQGLLGGSQKGPRMDGGGGSKGANTPGLDMDAILSMMNKMQNIR